MNDDEEEPGLHSPLAGRRATFAALVEEYQQPLGTYLLHMLGEVGVAAVLTEETFVCAYREYGACQSGLAVRPWLYRTATRLASEQLPLTRGAANCSGDRALVESVVRGLQMGERAVLLLCDFEQLPDDEAAAILGVSPARLRVRLERARAHFRFTYVECDAMAGTDRAG